VTGAGRCWAPKAGVVELELGGRRRAMTPVGDGWWEPAGRAPEHGEDYAFVLDGEGPFPDPRSPWQPAGVHGPSRWLDHGRFPWSDHGWRPPPLESGLVYELHVGTFTPEGTFDAVIARLDHLRELGVSHLELMPVAEFPGDRGWGYDGVDLYAPHHACGGPEGLKRLVDACHGAGLAVLLDVVYNHLGPDGNYLARFGPYFTDRTATPWGEAVNLDGPDSDQVRRFMIDNALMWLRDYHLDGLRIDAVHAIVDTSAIHLLEQLASEVGALAAHLGRLLVLVAESDLNDPRVVRPPSLGGWGLDAQWNEDFHHALHALLTGERDGYYADFGSVADLAAVLERGFLLDGRTSSYRRRRHGRPAAGLSGHRFVGCLQNHDQVGNRARGERIGHLVDPALARVGAALVFTSPFTPLLFQGEEWGSSSPFQYFTDHQDRALTEAVRQGRQREHAAFGFAPEEVPDPQAPETFARSRLDWDELGAEPHRSMLEWTRALARLRRRRPELTDGRMDRLRTEVDEARRRLRIERGAVTVCANLGAETWTAPVAGEAVLLLASDPGVSLEAGEVRLPPRTAAVLAP
jgi:maltooligosyltrehalose trehalohydrolase